MTITIDNIIMATSESLTETIQCACHERFADKTSGTAKLRLILASIIALVFMVGEILGEFNNINSLSFIAIIL